MGNGNTFWSPGPIEQRRVQTSKGLVEYADVGQVLKFNCPVSGMPYVYVPQGLEAPGQNIRIYVYDGAPVHGGARWCAVSKTGAAVGAAVVCAATGNALETENVVANATRATAPNARRRNRVTDSLGFRKRLARCSGRRQIPSPR